MNTENKQVDDSTAGLMKSFPENVPKTNGVYLVLDSSATGRIRNCRWSLTDMQWYDADEVAKYPVFTGIVWYFQE